MPHKILVVDDERINVALVKFGLAERHYNVDVAYDGYDGLERVKKNKPDLIVLDIQMPNINGYEFMAELKSIEGAENIPVIMLTANETLQDVFKLEGVKGYFIKPVRLPDLIEKITCVLGPNTI